MIDGNRSPSTELATRRFLFLLTGSRRDGNSEALARRAAEHLRENSAQRWLSLLDLDLPPFEDVRHAASGEYPFPDEPGATLLDATLWATDLVLVAPLYWYDVPARAKNYLDHWSGWMRVPGIAFQDNMAGKTMWAVTALSDEDYRVAEPLLGTLRLSAAYMRMGWGGELLGYGNRPGDILNDAAALEKATSFFAPAVANRRLRTASR
ncbi:flavodoxin family protein [Sphingomonas sp. URHD0057]|uniref:flavodoxin family protein n=1 Tax=Sphingomonas sp. URHD0057 TaxID=1380389 RepID=UPI000688E767|nr:NAD(P)H-dependent oxidoreductase [Sphingomonas sp. URHD0057]